MAVQLRPFDAAKYLSTAEDRAGLPADAFATGDQTYITKALGVIAHARGMSQVARDAGVTREALYKPLSPSGDPKLSTPLGVMRVLGISLSAAPAQAAE